MGVGVERRTPDYMVREELQREKMRNKAVEESVEFCGEVDGGEEAHWHRDVWRS